MKTYRMIAALLAIVMLLGVFAGCSKNSDNTTDPANPGSSTGTKTETNDEKAASTSKYAYEAAYFPMPEQMQYVNTTAFSGTSLYFTGSVVDGKQSYTDEVTGEVTEYDNYRTGLFKMDLETGECKELTGFQLPQVPEGWMGSSDLNNMQIAPDGTIWAVYGSYTYRYNPPADLAEDDSKYNYYEEGENKTGILHLDADGNELSRIELSRTEEEQSFYISSFLVDAAGNIYVSDWQTTYIYDQSGNKKAVVDLGENGGNLCEMKEGVVGVSYYMYDEAKPEESGRVFQQIDAATGKLTGEKISLPNDAYNFYPGDDV